MSTLGRQRNTQTICSISYLFVKLLLKLHLLVEGLHLVLGVDSTKHL